jgi:microcystin-dependent protein
MKTLTSTIGLLLLLFSAPSFAQAPNSFKYQAVLRNTNGQVIASQQVGLQISILKSSGQFGTPVFVETFSPTTNAFGLINLDIGSGNNLFGAIDSIDWAIDKYFLKIELDENGGTTYTNLGSTQLLSVPYALHAATSGNAFSGDYNDLNGTPSFAQVAFSGSYNDLNNKPSSFVPVGVIHDYAGSMAPQGYLMCYGQEISRTIYASLFAVIDTIYGTGDGSTTFNLPDLRGRASAGKDDMGGTSADRLTNQSSGVDGDALGGVGGEETHTLSVGEIPPTSVNFSNNFYLSGRSHSVGPAQTYMSNAGNTQTVTTNGGGGSHNNIQPTMVLNKIIKY